MKILETRSQIHNEMGWRRAFELNSGTTNEDTKKNLTQPSYNPSSALAFQNSQIRSSNGNHPDQLTHPAVIPTR